MNRETIDPRFAHQLEAAYWNNGAKDTFAVPSRISPVKDMFLNKRGEPKRRELRSGKTYEGVEVAHTLREGLVFYCYIIRNDLGEIARYYCKDQFISDAKQRERKLKDILG